MPRLLPIRLCLAPHNISNGTSMDERRKHIRTEINELAYVSAGGSVMTCMVRNISAEGAAIEVENPAYVPSSFRLVIAKNSAVHECVVAWIRQNRIGLTFVPASAAARE